MVSAGARLGPYEVLSALGRGGMGEVYLARDVRLGRQVVLKLLPHLGAADEEATARFLREARAAAALNHPNIVTVYDVGEDATCHFIAMELVRGRTLRDIGGTAPDPRTVADVGAQTARALDVAHTAGVVHRDMKPENVMVRDDGLVKVLDFGIARLLGPGTGSDDAGGTAALTAAGLVLGTARYMSPEQACGEAVGTPSDVFSLGLTLYEMATGVHPFAAKSDLALLSAIISQVPQPPSRVRDVLPPALDELVLAMLDKDPVRRPTAAEVSRALTEIAKDGDHRPSRTESAAPPVRRTVGRYAERAVLRAAMEAARAGHGSLVCVAGEAGMGKTTLVEDFVGELAAAGGQHIVARGRCSERLAGAEAYLPILDALDDLLRSDTAGLTARTMRTFAPTWFDQVGGDAAGAGAGGAASSERLKRELAAFLHELARGQAVVLFLEDLHWADAATVDFLAFLAPRLGTTRMLVLTTYRGSELLLAKHPFVSLNRDLQARGISRELRLGELTPAEAAEYMGREFPRHRFPADFVEMVHTKTGGSPLFLVDVLRYLREEEILRPDGDGWILAQTVPEIERELPASVRSMIQRKMDQLEDLERRLLATASVQGQEFDSAAVASVLGADPAEVEERLDRLEAVNAFVQRIDERELPDGTLSVRYRFAHVLYQNSFYSSLSPTRKANLSGAFARTLLGAYGARSGEIAADLALLFEAARDRASAATHFAAAARAASRVLATDAAAAYARRGLSVLAAMPEGPERAALEIQLLIPLAFAGRTLRGYTDPESGQHIERARALCLQLGDAPELPVVLYYISGFYIVGAQLEKSREVAEQLLAVGEDRNDDVTRIIGRTALGLALFHLGDVLRAHALFEQVVADHSPARAAQCRAVTGYDPGMYARAESIRTLWLLGAPARAVARADETLATAQRQNGDRVGLAFALVFRTFLAQFQEDAASTLEWADACIAHCDEHGIAQERQWVMPARGWALVRLGRVEEGLAAMRGSLEAQRAMGAELVFPYFQARLTSTLMSVGHLGEARQALDDANRVMEATGQRFYEAEQLRLAGELRLLAAAAIPGDTPAAARADAERLFRRGIEVARRQGVRALELRVVLSLARLRRSSGEWDEARDMLAECCAAIGSEGHGPAFQEATALLAER